MSKKKSISKVKKKTPKKTKAKKRIKTIRKKVLKKFQMADICKINEDRKHTVPELLFQMKSCLKNFDNISSNTS